MTEDSMRETLAQASGRYSDEEWAALVDSGDPLDQCTVTNARAVVANILEALARTPTATPSDEVVEEFLHELDGWERAYPLSVFPEPDMRKAAELLKAGGMTLDAISASNMRHVVSRIAPKARAAIAALLERYAAALEPFARYANLNDLAERDPNDVIEVPVRDVLQARSVLHGGD